MSEQNWKNSEVVSIFANKYLPQLEEERQANEEVVEPILEEEFVVDSSDDSVFEELYREAADERNLHHVVDNLEKIATTAALDGCEKAAYMIEQTIMLLKDKLEGN